MKKQLHQDVCIGIACLAVSMLIFALNSNIPAEAAMMPRLLAGMLAILSALIIAQGVKKSKLPAEQQGPKAISVDALKIPFITWGLIALYVILFKFTGYFIATGIMMLVLMRFMKRTSWPVMIAIAVVYLLLVYIVFVRVLSVSIDGFGMLSQLF